MKKGIVACDDISEVKLTHVGKSSTDESVQCRTGNRANYSAFGLYMQARFVLSVCWDERQHILYLMFYFGLYCSFQPTLYIVL